MAAGRLQPRRQPRTRPDPWSREETNTRALGQRLGDAAVPNRMASVWAALTTTMTTIRRACAASAGARRRAAAVGDEARQTWRETSKPATSNPRAQRGGHAEAHRAQADDGDARLLLEGDADIEKFP